MSSGLPPIGTHQRAAIESEVYDRARELVHEHDGRLRAALDALACELTGRDFPGQERAPATNAALGQLAWRDGYDAVLAVARELVDNVEQCWATDIIEGPRL